jgi:hypothetical protein
MLLCTSVTARAETMLSLSFLVWADFENSLPRNTLGGQFDAFGGFDNGVTSCRAQVDVVTDVLEGANHVARLQFDNEGAPFYSGFWMSSNWGQHENFASYDRITFRVRGAIQNSANAGFTLMIKDGSSTDYNANGVATRRIENITSQWTTRTVLFSDFAPLMPNTRINWKNIRQLLFVADNPQNQPMRGELYFDDVRCARGSQSAP